MNNQRNFRGFVVATHPGWHADEMFATWLMMRFAYLSPTAFVHFVENYSPEMDRLPEMTAYVGVGRDELDEHGPNGRAKNSSAASLTAHLLGVGERLEIKPILDAIHLGDVNGDQHQFNLDALLKPIIQLNPNAADLHRDLGVLMYRTFDMLAGYDSLAYSATNPIALPESLEHCAVIDQMFEAWQHYAATTHGEHASCERALRHMSKLWHDPAAEAQLLHLRNVCQMMLIMRGAAHTYALMEPLLLGFLKKQLDVLDYGRCHHEWLRAGKFETESGLKVAIINTDSPFMMTHLRLRKDLKNPDKRPDIAIIQYHPGQGQTKTSVWQLSENGNTRMPDIASAIARREFRLSGSTLPRERFAQELNETIKSGTSRHLPKTADNWYVQVTEKNGQPSWSLMNGTLTRSATPTRLRRPDWVEILLPL